LKYRSKHPESFNGAVDMDLCVVCSEGIGLDSEICLVTPCGLLLFNNPAAFRAAMSPATAVMVAAIAVITPGNVVQND
jgi:hypothetical protein